MSLYGQHYTGKENLFELLKLQTGRSRFLAMTDSYSDGSNSEDDDNNNNKGHGDGNLNYSSLSNDDDDNDEHYKDDDSYDSDSSGHFALGNKSRSLP